MPPDRGCHHPGVSEIDPDYEAWRESRWPPLIALALGVALYATLPGSLILGGGWLRWIIPALLLVLMVVSAVQPVAESDRRRHVGIALVVLITLANISAIALLLDGIVTESGFEGKYLVVSAVQVWFTNVIAFSLWFWEIDGGGPRHRALDRARPHDFLFAQYQVPEPWTWRPTYLDYLYVSITNSTSFAPADALPMRHRIKALMAVQSLLSVLVIIVIISRAVAILD
jgi:uncharacterized membrane protein